MARLASVRFRAHAISDSRPRPSEVSAADIPAEDILRRTLLALRCMSSSLKSRPFRSLETLYLKVLRTLKTTASAKIAVSANAYIAHQRPARAIPCLKCGPRFV